VTEHRFKALRRRIRSADQACGEFHFQFVYLAACRAVDFIFLPLNVFLDLFAVELDRRREVERMRPRLRVGGAVAVGRRKRHAAIDDPEFGCARRRRECNCDNRQTGKQGDGRDSGNRSSVTPFVGSAVGRSTSAGLMALARMAVAFSARFVFGLARRRPFGFRHRSAR
jgi:hypothetical protein